MSIGNILKQIRREYSRNAFSVVAYFPVLQGTLKESGKEAFRKAKSLLYHKCMSCVLQSLVDAGKMYVLICELVFFWTSSGTNHNLNF